MHYSEGLLFRRTRLIRKWKNKSSLFRIGSLLRSVRRFVIPKVLEIKTMSVHTYDADSGVFGLTNHLSLSNLHNITNPL